MTFEVQETQRSPRRSCCLGGVFALVLSTRGPSGTRSPTLPGTFSFAVLGDAPVLLLGRPAVRGSCSKNSPSNDLAAVIHIGDIFWRPCSDEMYRRSLDWFNALPQPVIYTPGDNDWTDCWERKSGRVRPARAPGATKREIFYADPGNKSRRHGRSQWSARRFTSRTCAGATRAWCSRPCTSSEAGTAWPDSPSGRARADDEAVVERTEAATAWLRETFAEAESESPRRPSYVAFHGNPAFENPVDRPLSPHLRAVSWKHSRKKRSDSANRSWSPTATTTNTASTGPSCGARTDGGRLDNVTRMQVPGSPRRRLGAGHRHPRRRRTVRLPQARRPALEVLVGRLLRPFSRSRSPGIHPGP